MTANAWVQFDIFQTTLGTAGQSLNADDTIKMALIDSTWTPNTATDVTFSVVDGDEVVGTGYTAGGATTAATWVSSVSMLSYPPFSFAFSPLLNTVSLTAWQYSPYSSPRIPVHS